jgi:hypothetical protein
MSNIPALIVTVIVAILAIVALIFALTMLDSGDSSGNHGGGTGTLQSEPAGEIDSEMFDIASQLVQDNYEVFRLFYLIDFVKEDHFEYFYNNEPEAINGFYTLKPGIIDYASVGEIFGLVDRTFSEEAAKTIRESGVYADLDGKIGVSEDFSPIEYSLAWGDVTVDLTFTSEDAYLITVTLTDEDTDEEVRKQRSMRKEEDGNWRLENIIR